MAKLSTHVLDTSIGKPAAGVQIDLFIEEDGDFRLLKSVVTNSDGRTDELLLDADSIMAGDYQITFHVGEYFALANPEATGRPFLNQVPIRFGISNPDENFHVPLLVTPWSYSTYRGS